MSEKTDRHFNIIYIIIIILIMKMVQAPNIIIMLVIRENHEKGGGTSWSHLSPNPAWNDQLSHSHHCFSHHPTSQVESYDVCVCVYVCV